MAIDQTTTDRSEEIVPNSTTTQVNEGEQQVAKTIEYYPMLNEILENADSGFEQQRISDFLAKPVLLTQGSFNTQSVLTQLSSINLPEDILAKALMK